MKKYFTQRLSKGAAASAIGIAAMSLSGCGAAGQGGTSGLYTPGTYTATADGIGKVTVKMTFDANKITDVVVDVSKETATIGGAAGDKLRQQLLAKQSSEIDGVSGATVTSTAVRKAAADCIAQAKGQADAGAGAAAAGTKQVVDWLGAEPQIDDSQISETLDTEVLIVGAGTGGMFAACSAGEQGQRPWLSKNLLPAVAFGTTWVLSIPDISLSTVQRLTSWNT